MTPALLLERWGARSMGLKLLFICLLALLMTIPAAFIAMLVQERRERALGVEEEISAQVGGAQTFLGPTLAVPYRRLPRVKDGPEEQGVWIIAPATATGTVKSATEERRRSLFRVPVYQADLKLDAKFDLATMPQNLPPDAQPDWSRAEILLGVSDSRGALRDAVLTIDGKTVAAAPAQVAPDLCFGVNSRKRPALALLGVPAGAAARPGAQFNVSSTLRFSGARRLAVLAWGKTTQMDMQGDWPSPGFYGGFLPVRRSITDSGYQASWSIPFIARGVRAEGTCEAVSSIDTTAFGVSFVEMADPYQSVSRSIKYSLLFVGLVFLTFFAFECSAGKRLHAAQYMLVGLAQMIFYLLLLSLAERIGFDASFLVAGAATVALLSTNIRWVFGTLAQSIRGLAAFALLYALMYALLRLEDNALLIGSVASFVAVAAVMYLTRNLDWFGTASRQREANTEAS